MRSEYFKGLNRQDAYNITDGLSIMIHEICLKKMNVNIDTITTDCSNEILELCDEAIESLHETIDECLSKIKLEFTNCEVEE